MRNRYLILLLILLAMSCHRKIKGRNSLERFPSEVYINTCGEIFDHFDIEENGNQHRYEAKSNTFTYLKIETTENGCVNKMVYGLQPEGLENIIFRINFRYHMDLKDQPYNGIVLFKENGKAIKADVTYNLFEVYLTDD